MVPLLSSAALNSSNRESPKGAGNKAAAKASDTRGDAQ
jgi:hypothetical protein